MIVILTRCIDLSVAANLALTGMVVAMINVAMPGLPVPVIIAISVGFGALLGMVNGVLVWKLAIPADRRDAGHDDDLPRHDFPSVRRSVGQQP
jgi:ribose/xylose/arabinose/galactoside ABC-type transport system permease subunit